MSDAVLLRANDLCKSYSGVHALRLFILSCVPAKCRAGWRERRCKSTRIHHHREVRSKWRHDRLDGKLSS